VRLETGLVIQGRVVDAAGTPASEAELKAAPAPVARRIYDESPERTARSDGRGRFLIGGLGEGTYEVTVEAYGFGRLMKPIDAGVLVAKLQEVVGGKDGRVIRVLMADDDPSVTAFVTKVLPAAKYHVEIAGNGEECLHYLRTQPRGFDVLVLDLMMPQVSGYDVLREMTLTHTAPDLPVLVLTNFPEARNAEERRLLEEGLVLDVLPKTAVHDNPQLLPHVIDWQMQVAYSESQQTRDLPRRSGAEPEEMAA